jgi:hypothetical protein
MDLIPFNVPTSKSLLYRFINLFSVNNSEYPNLFGHDLEDHPIILKPQLPIAT